MRPSTPFIEYAGELTENGYKLICFPYAGGGASYYAKWTKIFRTIEVIPIQLAGRENRIRENPMVDINEIADIVTKEISPYLKSGNFSIFGHSMGGLIGFETAKRLENAGLSPQVCFISGTSGEDYSPLKSVREMNDAELMEHVAKFGALNEKNCLVRCPELLEIYSNILRADFSVVENYIPRQDKIHCPIVAMCGDSDPMETIEKMHDWKNYTESGVIYRQYSGDHFYIDDNLKKLYSDIYSILTDISLKKRFSV